MRAALDGDQGEVIDQAGQPLGGGLIRQAAVFGAETYDAATFERWNIVNRVVPGGDLREAALAWARQLAKGPTLAHAVTKQVLRHALEQGSRRADRYLLDVAPPLLESRDMQYAVGLLLTQGARKFIQNHAEVVFEGR